MRAEIDSFFQLNELSVSSPGTLWEAFKVYISKQLGVLRDNPGCLSALETQIRGSETLFYSARDRRTLADLRLRIDEYIEVAESELNFLLLESRARQYGKGDGAG